MKIERVGERSIAVFSVCYVFSTLLLPDYIALNGSNLMLLKIYAVVEIGGSLILNGK